MTGRVNSSVIIKVENNVEQKPETLWAEEGADIIMTKVILSAPMSEDPVKRMLQETNRHNLRNAIAHHLVDVFRRHRMTTENVTRKQIEKGNF